MAPHGFTRIPDTEEGVIAEDDSRSESTRTESTSHDEILDGLLARVGYGTFQKRLLVNDGPSTRALFFSKLMHPTRSCADSAG